MELKEGVNLDIDPAGRILGLEFVEADDFPQFLAERAENLKGFSPA